MRAAIVCEPSLVEFAEAVHFSKYVRLGKGEEKAGGRTRPALLADVFESFIGALYLDNGIDKVVTFLERVIFQKLMQGHIYKQWIIKRNCKKLFNGTVMS